jgi:acyl-coenzyme A thioesterase PaaI-like protein
MAMFALADFSVYVAIIGRLGEPGVDAVTTNLNINFLAKPQARDMIATVRLLRVGRRLVVGEVEMFSDAFPTRWRTRSPATRCRPAPTDDPSRW